MNTKGKVKKPKPATLKKWSGKKPDFKKPPVSEVVLSLQFDPIEQLDGLQIGRLWDRYKKEYPSYEIKPAIPPVEESFGALEPSPIIQVSIVDGSSATRYWFENNQGTELIQVQRDRFIFNWKRGNSDDPYPRYEHVSKKFERHLKKFTAFLRENDMGTLTLNQCEVTYVNTLPQGEGWKNFSQVSNIFSPWSGRYSDNFLGHPEVLHFRVSHIMKAENGDPVGRLHISAEPQYSNDSQTHLYRFVFTARGAPLKKTQKSAFDFFDFARENIIRGFASFTTNKMHKVWERTDA